MSFYIDCAIVFVGAVLIAATAFAFIEGPNIAQEKALRQDIAHNFATKWNDCATAKRWVRNYDCQK